MKSKAKTVYGIQKPLFIARENKRQVNRFFKNSIILSLGSVLSKIIGAIYRIPLTNMLGGFGLGLYQMIFPVYSVLLDFSGAGVPSALSKLISEYNGTDREEERLKLLKNALILLFIFGIICTLFMGGMSKVLSFLQGNKNAYMGYIALAPAVVLVSIISCYRGYFQGDLNNVPTAVSQVTEQIVKLAFGLIFVKLLLPNIPLAVAGATFAVTLSEVFSLIELIVIFQATKNKKIKYKWNKKEFLSHVKKILKIVIPITLTSIIIPLSQLIDSFLIINLIGKYSSDATSLYGLLSGAVMTVINLPVSVCYGVAVSAIPLIAKARSKKDETSEKKNVKYSILLTFLIALPSMAFCYLFAPFITNLLFRNLSGFEKLTVIKLLKLSSVNIVLLSFVQTTNAVLIAKNAVYIPVINLSVGVVSKIILNVILLHIKTLNIYGGAIAVIVCYLLAGILNLLYIINNKDKRKRNNGEDRQGETQ